MTTLGDPTDSSRPRGALVLIKLSEETLEAAALTVAGRARDAGDCRDLLEMLGLIPPGPPLPCRKLDPSARAKAWKAAQKRLDEQAP